MEMEEEQVRFIVSVCVLIALGCFLCVLFSAKDARRARFLEEHCTRDGMEWVGEWWPDKKHKYECDDGSVIYTEWIE